MEAMRAGDFASAWTISDACLRARLARGDPPHTGPRHLQSIWNGEPLAGKRVLVRCYHGLGDTIQFIRFAAPLRRLADAVIVWVQQPLMRLVRTARGVDHVIPLHDGTPDVAFDANIECMELAHALRVHEHTVACAVPYLFPDLGKDRLPRSGNKFSVGLVWRAGQWDDSRSIPARLLSPIAEVSGTRLFSLQIGPAAAEAARIPAQDLSSQDIEELAATLCHLDLLVSVDTCAAHLAGALGVPVWLLLPTPCDWRWMKHRTDCVWYPTMRLFRQSRPGDWQPVVEDVAASLRELADTRASQDKLSGTNVCI
jgi:ADP-heptose:LPS heptosyltransferase